MRRNYPELVLYKALTDLRAEAARTYIGFAWWIIEPAIYMAIFYVVFSKVLQRGMEDFVPFLLVGLVVWRWTHTTCMHGMNSIRAHTGLMQQLYLPKIFFPTTAIVVNTIKFLIVFIMLLVFLWIYGYSVTWHYFWLIPLLVAQLALITAGTYFLAAFTPFLPDLTVLVDNGLRGLFFLSGIFFSVANIDEPIRTYLYWNPMATIIEGYRDVLLYERSPGGGAILLIAVVSILGTVLGAMLISRYDRVFPKLVP